MLHAASDYFDPQLLKWAVWLKHCFSFKYLAKISFNQKMTQLVWSPWFNQFEELLDDFSNVSLCVKIRGVVIKNFGKLENIGFGGY